MALTDAYPAERIAIGEEIKLTLSTQYVLEARESSNYNLIKLELMSAKTWAIVGASVAAVGLIAGALFFVTRDDEELVVDLETNGDVGSDYIPVEEPLTTGVTGLAPPEPAFARRDSLECVYKIARYYEAALAFIESTEAEKAKLSDAYDAILAAQQYSRVELVGNEDFLDWIRDGDATLFTPELYML